MAKVKKVIKSIHVDISQCNGCLACEMICSAFHAEPKYSTNNPDRSRIRVVRDPIQDIYLPIYAGNYAPAECMGRMSYQFEEDGRVYSECDFCRDSCESRDIFREPDSKLPLKCDMCEDEPEQEQPLCVKWCVHDALIYEVREEEVDEAEELDDVEVGIQSLVDKHGLVKLVETITRMTAKEV